MNIVSCTQLMYANGSNPCKNCCQKFGASNDLLEFGRADSCQQVTVCYYNLEKDMFSQAFMIYWEQFTQQFYQFTTGPVWYRDRRQAKIIVTSREHRLSYLCNSHFQECEGRMTQTAFCIWGGAHKLKFSQVLWAQ